MNIKMSKSFVASFLITTAFSAMLISCGQKSGEATVELKHKVDSDAKTDVEKARAQCFSSMDPVAISKKADGKNKFCSETLVKDSAPAFAFKGLDRSFKLVKSADSKLIVTINAGVKFSDSSLSAETQQKFIKNMTDECLPNLVTFWSKSNVSIKLNFALSSETDAVDQTLNLDLVGDVDSGLKSKANMQISEWPESATFSNKMTSECKTDRDKNTTDGESKKDSVARVCVKKQNQNFCLALNKMVGYWVGAEDLNDLTCSGAETPPAKGQSPSFMSYSIVAEKNLLVAVEPNQTPDQAPDQSKDQSKEGPAQLTSDETLAGSDSPTTAVAAVSSQDLKSSAEVYDALNAIGKSTPTTPAPDVPADADTSADTSYQIWNTYKISPENLKSMFDCDLSTPVKNNMQAVRAKIAPVKATAAKLTRK